MYNTTKYEIVHCKLGEIEAHFKGIKIDEKRDVKRVTHSASYNPVGVVTGDITIDFTLTEPKDERALYDFYRLWEATHQMFNITILARNIRTNALEPIVMLEGCVLTKIDRNVSGREEWKPSASGIAMGCSHINYQYDEETGMGKYAMQAISGVDAITATSKGYLNLTENVGNTIKKVLGK